MTALQWGPLKAVRSQMYLTLQLQLRSDCLTTDHWGIARSSVDISTKVIINSFRSSPLMTNASTSQSQLCCSSESVALTQSTKLNSYESKELEHVGLSPMWPEQRAAIWREQENFLCNELNITRKNKNIMHDSTNLTKKKFLSWEVN